MMNMYLKISMFLLLGFNGCSEQAVTNQANVNGVKGGYAG